MEEHVLTGLFIVSRHFDQIVRSGFLVEGVDLEAFWVEVLDEVDRTDTGVGKGEVHDRDDGVGLALEGHLHRAVEFEGRLGLEVVHHGGQLGREARVLAEDALAGLEHVQVAPVVALVQQLLHFQHLVLHVHDSLLLFYSIM